MWSLKDTSGPCTNKLRQQPVPTAAVEAESQSLAAADAARQD